MLKHPANIMVQLFSYLHHDVEALALLNRTLMTGPPEDAEDTDPEPDHRQATDREGKEQYQVCIGDSESDHADYAEQDGERVAEQTPFGRAMGL